MSPRSPAPATDTRQRILDVSTELFREHGYSGTSIRDIADRLGMTKAALYYHFSCKDDVLSALVAPTVEAIEAFIETAEQTPDADPVDLLRQFVLVLGRSAPMLATTLGDPVVMKTEAGRFRLLEKQARLVALIAGPGADETRRLRAAAALGAIKSAMENLAPICPTVESTHTVQRTVQQNVERHLDTIVAAAVGALQG